MRIASLLRRRLRALFRRSSVEREMNSELAFHFELEKQQRMRAGASPAEAHRAAIHAFGGMDHVKEAYRDARGTRPLENLMQDLRYGARVLRRNPLFAGVAITTLALGLGATLAVFNVVNGVLLRPLPYRDPERINIIWFTWRGNDGNVMDLPLSSGSYSDIERDSRSFAAMAAFRAWPYAIAESPEAEREAVAGARVSPALFDVLGVSPAIGRAFTREDAVPGGPNVALISHDLWQRKFGGNRDIVGRRIYLGDAPFTLAGVMPPGFAFPRGAELPTPFQFGLRTDVWTPLVFDSSDVRDYNVQNLVAVGKLAERCGTGECSASVAQAELTELVRRDIPAKDQPKLGYKLVSMADQGAARIRRPLLTLLGAVAFVLAIAVANVTSLLVGRIHARERELAVRAALGAARGRLARQLMTENLVLCVLGMVLGLMLAFWGTKVMLALVPGSLPRADDIGFDWRVLSAAVVLALIAALGLGVAAAYAARLRFTRAQSSASRTRRLLVMTEVALSLVLLIGAGLLTRSFMSLQQVRPGFDPSNVLTVRVAFPVAGRPQPRVDGARWTATFDQVIARLASAPGIMAAGAALSVPMSGGIESGGLRPVGKVYEPGQNPSAELQVVAGDFFRAARIRPLAGRMFDGSDDAPGRASMIVNRRFAREQYGSEAGALGKEVQALFEPQDRPPRVIVGVVDDVKNVSLDADARAQVYVPLSQVPTFSLTLLLRVSDSDPLTVAPAVRQAVHAVNASLTVKEVRTFESVVADSLARQRFDMMLIATFAILALVLASVGLYGVLALIVGQRRREIGVRLALGATPGSVVRGMLGEGARVVVIGVAIGLAGAFALTRVLSSMLYGISTTDGATFAGAAAFVGLVAILATWVPARRASQVDPRTALAAE